jgi:hypothetical protein
LAASARGVAGGEGVAVIPPPAGVRVPIATRPVDFRKGAASLSALAQDPCLRRRAGVPPPPRRSDQDPGLGRQRADADLEGLDWTRVHMPRLARPQASR